MCRVLLMGAYPPPVGGNSVHIQRLKEILDAESSFRCKVLDIYSPKDIYHNTDVTRIGPPGLWAVFKALLFLLRFKPDVFHVHVSAMGRFLYVGFPLLFFIPKHTKKIITIHSGSFVKTCKQYSYLKLFFIKNLLNKFNIIIAVNNEQQSFLINEGINVINIVVLPAYIAPEPEFSDELDKIIKKIKIDCNKLIVTSGYGVPLYGFEKIISLVNGQSEYKDSLGLIICTYNTYDDEYMDFLLSQINDNMNIVILKNLTPGEFAYILKFSDIYIRATDRDGDAVAIREANHFNVPVLASNVVKRPQFCQLFDLDSDASLRNSLHNILRGKRNCCGKNNDDNIIDKIKEIYGL